MLRSRSRSDPPFAPACRLPRFNPARKHHTSPRTRLETSVPKTSLPKTTEDLLAYLDQLRIATTTVEHPPLHTVEDSRALRGKIPGGHTNLTKSHCRRRS